MAREYKKAECSYCKELKLIAAKGLCRACYQRNQKNGSLDYKPKRVRNICEVDGCDKFVITHGLCDKHRQRLVKHGHLEPTRPNDWGNREKHPLYIIWAQHRRYRTKHSLCKEWHEDFWLFVEKVKGRPSKKHHLRPIDEKEPICNDNWHWIELATNGLTPEDKKAYTTQWIREDRKRNPGKYKDKDLKKQYGIGLDEYNQMLKEQDGKCKICENEEVAINPQTKEPRRLAVDHCHSTGKVRGLLCSKCNTAIGALKDSVELLGKAILYLRSST